MQEKDNSFTTHDRNLQKLALLMYKVKHKLCLAPIQEIFRENENAPNLRMDGDWVIPRASTVNYGIDTEGQ